MARTPKRWSLGRLPVVVLPLEDYERMKEDLEMFHSQSLEGRIRRAREEAKKGKVFTLDQVKKKLNLP